MGITKSWKKATRRQAVFDFSVKRPRGIRGCFARLFSLQRKNPPMQAPATIRPITVGLFHGKVAPPKSRPSRSITINPRTEAVPNQSIALIPVARDVRGLWTSKKKRRRRKAVPQIGRLIQKIKRQERNSVSTPPSIGPIAPATAQMMLYKPM